jgi:hypothetical protein
MITLEAQYAKKVGLPGFSSHQFSITLKSELSDVSQVEQESARLYDVLQNSVDSNIQQVGFLPGDTKPNGNGNGHTNGNGNGHQRSVRPTEDPWKCSPAQKDLILKITDEHKLDKTKVDQLAHDRFGKGVKQLNKLESSALIEELLEQNGQSKPRSQRFAKGGAR